MKLSVVMPVYNERATLRQVVERVLAVPSRWKFSASMMVREMGRLRSWHNCKRNFHSSGFSFNLATWAKGRRYGAEFRKPPATS